MISLELWRARIGTFNNKRCGSGCSLSSLSSRTASSPSSSHCRRHRGSTDISQEEPAEPTSAVLTSSSSLVAEEQSEAFPSTDHHSVLTTSSSQLTLSCSSQSYGSGSSALRSSSSFFPTSGSLLRSLLRDAVITLLIAIISQLLLMVAGDIETNPGPKHGADDKPDLVDLQCMSYTGEDGRDTHFRLMDQLQPHWRRLAVALRFNIAVMKQEDDPVFYLLIEWLQGANQERDLRPVTWATLITALRDANFQEEADILKKHFVETMAMSQAEVPRPTMADLISMKMRDGSEKKLRIIDGITAHTSSQCNDFAYKLLCDTFTVRLLQRKYDKEGEFIRAVLVEWVSRDDDDSEDGSLPCTWDTLVHCAYESCLDENFLKLLKDNVPTGATLTPESLSSPPIMTVQFPRPTMSDLTSMEMRDGSKKKLRIIDWITLHTYGRCVDLAHLLLNDTFTVRLLQNKYRKEDEFVQAVLDKWVSRDDDDDEECSLPCTWDTLVQCGADAGLEGYFLKLLKENLPIAISFDNDEDEPNISTPPAKRWKISSQSTDTDCHDANYGSSESHPVASDDAGMKEPCLEKGVTITTATGGTHGERPKYPMELIDDMSATYDPLLPSDASQQEEIKKFAANQVNVIIQSCNKAEYYAALEKMEAATKSLPMFDKPVKYPTGKYTIVVGTFAGNNAAIVRTGQGNKCRNDLKEILGFFPRAKYLLGLGVCMGIKGKFGDVLIGKMVQIEENLKLENGKLVLRGPCGDATQAMRNIFCDDTAGWKGFECTATAEGSTSKPRTSLVFPGCILSSSALLNDKDIKQELEKASQALIGAEMEGWVLFTAFKDIESIIIKGISDYGDGTKADDWQLTAAKAAVDYAHFKLERSFLD